MSQSVADDVVSVDMTGVGSEKPAAWVSADGAVFATPEGDWVRQGSREFFTLLGDTDPDYDAPLYAVKNFGFISVRVNPSALVDIKLNPQNVTSAALGSTLDLLSLIKSVLFRISYLKENWVTETMSSSVQAICRLAEICDFEEVGDALRGSASRLH